MKRAIVVFGSNPEPGASPSLADRAALAAAMRLFGRELTVWAMPASSEALRYALAAGTPDANLFNHPDELLAAYVECDAAFLGTSCPLWGDLLGAMLTERAGGTLVCEVLDAQRISEGYRIVRDLGRGDREVIQVRGPVVCLMSNEARRAPYVSRYRRELIEVGAVRWPTFADNREVEAVDWQPVRPRTKLSSIGGNINETAAERLQNVFGVADGGAKDLAQRVVIADAETCAARLVRYLIHNDFLERRASLASLVVEPPRKDHDVVAARLEPSAVEHALRKIPDKLLRSPHKLGQPRTTNPRGPFPLSI